MKTPDAISEPQFGGRRCPFFGPRAQDRRRFGFSRRNFGGEAASLARPLGSARARAAEGAGIAALAARRAAHAARAALVAGAAVVRAAARVAVVSANAARRAARAAAAVDGEVTRRADDAAGAHAGDAAPAAAIRWARAGDPRPVAARAADTARVERCVLPAVVVVRARGADPPGAGQPLADGVGAADVAELAARSRRATAGPVPAVVSGEALGGVGARLTAPGAARPVHAPARAALPVALARLTGGSARPARPRVEPASESRAATIRATGAVPARRPAARSGLAAAVAAVGRVEALPGHRLAARRAALASDAGVVVGPVAAAVAGARAPSSDGRARAEPPRAQRARAAVGVQRAGRALVLARARAGHALQGVAAVAVARARVRLAAARPAGSIPAVRAVAAEAILRRVADLGLPGADPLARAVRALVPAAAVAEHRARGAPQAAARRAEPRAARELIAALRAGLARLAGLVAARRATRPGRPLAPAGAALRVARAPGPVRAAPRRADAAHTSVPAAALRVPDAGRAARRADALAERAEAGAALRAVLTRLAQDPAGRGPNAAIAGAGDEDGHEAHQQQGEPAPEPPPRAARRPRAGLRAVIARSHVPGGYGNSSRRGTPRGEPLPDARKAGSRVAGLLGRRRRFGLHPREGRGRSASEGASS